MRSVGKYFRIWELKVLAYLKHGLEIRLEELRNATKLSVHTPHPDRNLSRIYPKTHWSDRLQRRYRVMCTSVNEFYAAYNFRFLHVKNERSEP
jgi:hypothetical protein